MVEVHVEEVSGGTSTAGIPERTGGIRSGLPVSMLPVAAALRALGADCLRSVGRVGRSDVVSTMETVTEKTIDWRCRRHSWRGGIWRRWCSSGYSVSIMRASQGLQVISSSGFPHTFTSQDGQLYFVLVLTFLAVLASGS